MWLPVLIALMPVLGASYIGCNRPSPPEEQEYVGRVRDENTSEPIYDAKVSIEEDQKGPQVLATDSEGVFRARLRPSTKDVRVIIDADGYERLERLVAPERTGSEPFRLRPKAALPQQASVPQPTSQGKRTHPSGKRSFVGPRHTNNNANANLRTRREQAINILTGKSPTSSQKP